MKICPSPRIQTLFIVLATLFSGLISQGHNDQANLYRRETAGADPDRIFLSFHGDPATTRAVTWRTDTSIDSAIAQIALSQADPDFSKSALTIPATTEVVDLSLHSGNAKGMVHYHSVIFRDLQPDSLYAYRVGSDGHWSEWIQFRTAKTEPDPFSFVYFGDAQNAILSKWSRVIRMSFETAPDAMFAIHAGDLVDNGHIDKQWAEWFQAGGWIHSQRTGIPVVGNHEYRPIPGMEKENVISMIWRPQFTLPEEPSLPKALQETVYTIDYQGVRIIVLNCITEPEAQVDYLRQQLERPGAVWTILTSHFSIFSPLEDRSMQHSSKLWLPVIEEYGVDLVLQGHDHAYARGNQPSRKVSGSVQEGFQTLFVTSVSGPKQYKVSEEALQRYAGKGYQLNVIGEQKQFFQVLNVDGHRLTYTAYTADGEVYDKVTITKNPETGLKQFE